MADSEKNLKLKIKVDQSDLNKTKENLKQTGQEGAKAGSTIANAFKAIAMGAIGAKLTSFFKASIEEANDAETQFLKLKNASEKAGVVFDDLKTKIVELGRDGLIEGDNLTKMMT